MRTATAVVILAVLACSAVFAQQDSGRDVYVKTVRIAKVYPHGLGYRILYFKSTMEYAEMYVPTTWFSFAGEGKANVIWGNVRRVSVHGDLLGGRQIRPDPALPALEHARPHVGHASRRESTSVASSTCRNHREISSAAAA